MDVNGLIGFGVNFPLYAAESTIINSIQQFEIAITSGNTSGTATLSPSVDATKSIIIPNGERCDETGSHYNHFEPRFTLTDGSTVTVNINDTGNNTRTVRGWVVEFKSFAIRNLYYGTVTLTGVTSNTDTPGFTPVIDANTVAIFLGNSVTDESEALERQKCTINYSFSANTITAQRGSSTGNATVSYVLIEFNPGILLSKTQVSIAIGSGNSSNTAALPHLDLAKAVSFNGGFRASSNTFQDEWSAIYVKDANTAEAKRDGTGSNTTTARFTVVEFASRWIKSIQRGQEPFLYTETTHDFTVSSVSTSKSFISFLEQYNHNGFAETGYIKATAEQTAATNLRLKRLVDQTAGFLQYAVQPTISWELVEFN